MSAARRTRRGHGADPGPDEVPALKPDELAEAAARPLADLQTGERGIISCVDEADPELLRYLASLWLLPETRVSIESVAPFGGPQLVRVCRAQYALGREVAARVFVRV